ncbi:MAG: SIR2 family protein [Pseudomonadota bacterium]
MSSAMRLADTLDPPPAALQRLKRIAAEIAMGRIIPYLGPGVLGACTASRVPITPVALAMALHERAPVGAKLRGNMWGTAQFIEQRRHRKTLVAILADIFEAPVEPGALHAWLARLQIPLIVDTWYDAALARAFREAGRRDFAEVQGVTRALETRDVWVKCYAPEGVEIPSEQAATARTIIYKPHGSVAPAHNFLVADSDYVEVLTEIDIQSPIPDTVQQRRTGRGFLFIGCRFDDQMLRTYARQIMKRSGGPSYAVMDFEPTRMEERFFAEHGIEPLACALPAAIAAIASV